LASADQAATDEPRRAAATKSLGVREDEWAGWVERQAARERAVEQRVERKARRGAGTVAGFMKVRGGGAVKREESRGGSGWEARGVETGGNSCNRRGHDSGSRPFNSFLRSHAQEADYCACHPTHPQADGGEPL
jgi:hypothetical protein